MKKCQALFVFLLLVLFSSAAFAQIGGKGVYKFINLPPSSRIASLGGNLISVKDDDVTLSIQNPSLLNKEMHNKAAISYIDYVSDINVGSVIYVRDYDSIGTFSGGMQYINYGDFVKADEKGNKIGTFSASEYNFFIGYGNTWKRFSYGSQMKIIYSQLATFPSSGLALDLAGTYQNLNKNFTLALVLKNIGFQFKPYEETREPMPFEIQLGTSYKPKHMPLRFSMVLHNLQKFDLTYTNPQNVSKDIQGNETVIVPPFSEKIARHFIFGAELLLTKNFNLRVGYNHKQRKEMSIEDNRGLVGFSYGLGFRISHFNISYGRTSLHLAGPSNTFTIIADFNKIFKRAAPKDAAAI